jgi:hypothetical protein
MSDADRSTKEPDASRPDWRLPEVIDIKIRLLPYHAPRLRHFKSKFAKYNQAVEFLVKTDGSIPARALSPAIFVDNVQIIEGEIVDRNTIRFLSFEPDQLQEDAPILLGWQDDPKELRKRTKFRFHQPSAAD